jgi:hypothetical protein
VEQIRAEAFPSAGAIKAWGMSCALPGSLMGSLYTAYHQPRFDEGVRFSTLSGGDNCSR